MKISPLESWIKKKIGSTHEQLNRTELAAWQVDQFNQTILLVKQKSTYYQQKFSHCPDKITTLKEIQSFPFTRESDVCAFPNTFICVSQNEIDRIVTLNSSGTTGSPKRIYFSRSDQDLTIDFFGIGMSTLTQPGDRVLILLPGERPGGVGDLLRLGLLKEGRIPIPYGFVKNPSDVTDKLRSECVDCIVGTPTQVLGLATRTISAEFAPKSVLLSTDYVPSSIVKRIQDAWHCEVYNHYGATEMGLGGGVECEAHRGYHLREADLYFEIIDPDSGRNVEDGQWGEVVYSTLTRNAMPFIRYRSGDLARFLPGDCPCGSTLKTMEKVQGRLQGFFSLSESVLKLSHFDEALFSIQDLLNFSITMTGKRTMPELTINIQFLTNNDRVEEVKNQLRTISITHDLKVKIVSQFNPNEPGSMHKRVIYDQRVQEN